MENLKNSSIAESTILIDGESNKISPENLQTSSDLQKITQQRDELLKNLQDSSEEREKLLKVLDRKTSEIERLEAEVEVLQSQLKSSVEAKCLAITKYDEIQSKMTQIEFKERRFDQERSMMEKRIETLTSDLDRNIQELQKYRKESTTQVLTLEAKLHEKSEELEISGKQIANLKELNSSLSTQVEDLSEKLLKFNENFSTTMQKYQQELKAKTRLSELYKEKSEDVLSGQKDITSVVSELRNALNEATEEYGKIETTLREKEAQHEQEREELVKVIENLQTELENSRQENIEKSIEKLLCPSGARKLSGKSITEIFTLYIKTSDELEKLKAESFELKKNFADLVIEIKEKAPEIQKSHLEIEKLNNENEILKFKLENVLREKFEMQNEIEVLVFELQSLKRNFVEVQDEKNNLTQQLIQIIKQKSNEEDFSIFGNVEELYDNNLKLVGLIKELSAEIEKLKVENLNNESLKISTANFRNAEVQTEGQKFELQGQKGQNYELQGQKGQNYEVKVQNENLKTLEDLKKKNENLTQELRSQQSEFSMKNFKLKSQLELQEGQLKLQKKNVESLKQKIQNLDDRLQAQTKTNAKLETILQNLNAELRNCEAEVKNLKRKNESLMRENQIYERNEAKLKAECEVFQRQSQLQAHMMSNLEFIKASIERSEKENRSKFEDKIDEISREFQVKIEKISKEREELKNQLENERKEFEELEEQANKILAEKDEEINQLHHALSKAYEDLEKLSEKKVEKDLSESQSFVSCAGTDPVDKIDSNIGGKNDPDEMKMDPDVTARMDPDEQFDVTMTAENEGLIKNKKRNREDDEEIEEICEEKKVKVNKSEEIISKAENLNESIKCRFFDF